MAFFRDFTVPLWEIFGGNLLMLITIAFYISWWTAWFRPNADGRSAGAGMLIAVALIAGIAAIVILSMGFQSLPRVKRGLPVAVVLLGAVAFYVILLAVTKIAFQRVVTSELLLITVWAALELSALTVLQANGRFGMGRTIALAALVALATVTGLVCYVLHYRLDETARFWNGLIPLVADGGVVAVFLALLAFS